MTRSNCGSGLAREGGVSVNISITDPPPSRASPLPQLIAFHIAYRDVLAATGLVLRLLHRP
ncbi:hypothetical protein FIV38_21170 [Pseudomonas proteolytica]|nr:hypothetical protein F4W61_18650 [Pseudomonas proteolytica]TWR77704.1 hypothetical protein FIV38_21170 [Pseudomonas proteolytica]